MQTEQTTRSPLIANRYIIAVVIGVLLLGALLIAGVYFISRSYSLEISVVRDLFVIALALEGCLIGLVVLILLVMVVRLVNTVEFEIKPILEKTNKVISTAKGTTEFLSESVAQPAIKARGYIEGVKAGAKTLLGDPKKQLPK